MAVFRPAEKEINCISQREEALNEGDRVRKQVLVSPITRANNCGHVAIILADGKVTECQVSALFFRNFEVLLKGRDPRDAPYLTQRICGICSAAHATAAAYALEDLAGVRPPKNGHLIRNLILAADTLQNHIRHFYLLVLPDYVRGLANFPPGSGYQRDYRLPPEVETCLADHYFEAVGIARTAHEIVAALGGKAPHNHGILPGGATVTLASTLLAEVKTRLGLLSRFIKKKMLSDAEAIGSAYPEYFTYGSRPQLLLSYGFFPEDPERKSFHFPGGAVEAGHVRPVEPTAIAEHLHHTYFAPAAPQSPTSALTVPQPGKPEAYSWIKAPRYAGKAFEGGPLARLWIAGRYQRGVSTLDRILARVKEAALLCDLMEEWLGKIKLGGPLSTPYEVPREGEGLGLTDAMRGPLLHYLRVEGKRLSHYEIITPSAWNFSPRDDAEKPGPVEEALLGTPVANPEEPVEIGRIIRSFDPCFACATHILEDIKKLTQSVF